MTSSAPDPHGSRALVDDMSFLLARASALSNAAGNAALADYGLTVRSYSVLELAADGGRTSQREIAEFLRLDPSQEAVLQGARLRFFWDGDPQPSVDVPLGLFFGSGLGPASAMTRR